MWGRSSQLGGPLPARELARIVLFRAYSTTSPSQTHMRPFRATAELYGAALRLFGLPYSGTERPCEKIARIVRSRGAVLRSVLLHPVPSNF